MDILDLMDLGAIPVALHHSLLFPFLSFVTKAFDQIRTLCKDSYDGEKSW